MAGRADLIRVAQEFEDCVRQIKGEVGRVPPKRGPIPHGVQAKGAPNCVEVAQRCGGILVRGVQAARPIGEMDVVQFAKPIPQVDVPPLNLCPPNFLRKRELGWTAEA